MKTTLKGKKDKRSCAGCDWCPKGAPRCAWRIGLYLPEMSPIKTEVVLHPTRIAGINCFVAQPYKDDILAPAAAWLAKTAEYSPVVMLTAPVLKGGVVQAVLAPTAEIGEAVCKALDFGQPQEPLVAEVTAEEP